MRLADSSRPAVLTTLMSGPLATSTGPSNRSGLKAGGQTREDLEALMFADRAVKKKVVNGCSHLLAFLPQALRDGEWIDLVLLPPRPLIAGCMVLLMVNGAERDREFVARL